MPDGFIFNRPTGFHITKSIETIASLPTADLLELFARPEELHQPVGAGSGSLDGGE